MAPGPLHSCPLRNSEGPRNSPSVHTLFSRSRRRRGVRGHASDDESLSSSVAAYPCVLQAWLAAHLSFYPRSPGRPAWFASLQAGADADAATEGQPARFMTRFHPRLTTLRLSRCHHADEYSSRASRFRDVQLPADVFARAQKRWPYASDNLETTCTSEVHPRCVQFRWPQL